MSRGNFNLHMQDFFPPLFGDDHDQHDPPDSRDYVHPSINHDNGSYYVTSTSLPFQLNEQYVEKDFDTKGNDGLLGNNDGVTADNNGFRENYQGFVVESHYPNANIEENIYPNEGAGDNRYRVLPCQSGEGLPYAPINWPEPGDNWSWRVGKRFNHKYHFNERFLYPPKRLRKITNAPARFPSKPSVQKYILSHFPNADTNAFFASFTWKIPVDLQFAKKVEAITDVDQLDAVNRVLYELEQEIPKELPKEIPKEIPEVILSIPKEIPEEIADVILSIPEEIPKEIPEVIPSIPKEIAKEIPEVIQSIPKEIHKDIPEVSPSIPKEIHKDIPEVSPSIPKEIPKANAKIRKRRQKSTYLEEDEEEYTPPSWGRKKKKEEFWELEVETPYSTGRTINWMETGLEEFEEQTHHSSQRRSRRKPATPPPPVDQKPTRRSTRTSASKSKQTSRFSSGTDHVMDGRAVVYVAQEEPVSEDEDDFDKYLDTLEDVIIQPTEYNSVNIVPFYDEDDMAEARSRLSSLLVMDFPSLVSPEIISELTTLASKLQRDPTLSADQLVKLKLIEDISSYAEVFLESGEVIEEVNNFLSGFDANKNKVCSLKNEYKELKGKAYQHKKKIKSGTTNIDRIDRQIAELQDRRAKLTESIDIKNDAKTEVTLAQKMVAAEIPNVVHKIQEINSKMLELKRKRADAVSRVTETLARFSSLQGFIF